MQTLLDFTLSGPFRNKCVQGFTWKIESEQNWMLCLRPGFHQVLWMHDREMIHVSDLRSLFVQKWILNSVMNEVSRDEGKLMLRLSLRSDETIAAQESVGVVGAVVFNEENRNCGLESGFYHGAESRSWSQLRPRSSFKQVHVSYSVSFAEKTIAERSVQVSEQSVIQLCALAALVHALKPDFD